MDICVVRKKVKPLAKLYGLAKGKAAGFADGIKEVAKALKKKGMDIQEISKLTGLSKEEVENL